MRLRSALLLAAAALTLSACASFSPDGGMNLVAASVSQETGKDVAKIDSPETAALARARVKALLQKPLTADSAVQIALLNNRGLQADYNDLGISEAAYVEASLPPNPALSIGASLTDGTLEIERRLALNIVALFTMPARKEIAAAEYEAAKFRAIEATFRQAVNTRKAYYRAVAARQRIAYLEKTRLSAEAAADLTTKLGETGAATKLNQARASVFYAEVSSELAEAKLEAASSREDLIRELGLWGDDIKFSLPSALPNLPAKLAAQGYVEIEAVKRRTDLMAAWLELRVLSKELGLDEATRYVPVLELAGFSNYERTDDGAHVEEETTKGVDAEAEFEIPIFDLGRAGRRGSQQRYAQAVNRFTQQAINVRSEARQAYQAMRATYDISLQYRNRIVPLRNTINEQALLEYNGMLVDVFELLTTVRENMESILAAIDAKLNYHIANTDLQAAVIGGGSAESGGEAAGERTAEAAAGGGH